MYGSDLTIKRYMADTGPDYVVQTSRFTIVEGFGCTSSATSSGLSLVLIQTWNFVPSLISVVVYYRAYFHVPYVT